MSALTLQDIILTILQAVVLIPVIISSAKQMEHDGNKLLPVFFTFAMVSFLLSDMYYIVYDMLIPDVRMPFAANEIAECATILLLSAGLETISEKRRTLNIGEIIYIFIFMGTNIALWIAWSGEIAEDIVFGIPYIYFFYVIMRGIKQTCAISKNESLTAMLISMAIIIMQTITLITNDPVKVILENICYVLLFASGVWLFIKCILAIRSFSDKPDRMSQKSSLCISSAFFLWTILTLFMSAGVYYGIAMILNTLSMPVMLWALKRYYTPGMNDKPSGLYEHGGDAV